ncbi:MAG: DUF4783 domain-containing protein [Treponema sp.]|jgi:hypothetical protein|nr:DUF4783 domain-containing protein [Treponema sp.]
MIVIDALVHALRVYGIPVIEQPQAAANTNAHLDLWLAGFTAGGEKGNGDPFSYETMTFTADVVSSGVARQFVGDLRHTLRTMAMLGETYLDVPVAIPAPDNPEETRLKKLRAFFEKTASGAFEYESEEAPMPVRFKESWRITITYPADIIPQ